MKIFFFETPESERTILRDHLKDINVTFYEEKLSIDNVHLAKEADAICIFTDSEINRNIIDGAPNLKFITTRSTGYDHIDIPYCKEKNILVSNVPSYGSTTVAEFAFALILTLSRNVFDAVRRTKEGGDFSFVGLKGFDLAGKTLGVIGTGRIGKNVIKMAQGFNMKVIAYDMFPDKVFAESSKITYKTLDEILSESDVITIHTPYTNESHHMINKESIMKMKKGVHIVNTARGEIIDTDALLWGLREKIIGGAGLDVLEGEREVKEEKELLANPEKAALIKDYRTLLEDSILMEMPNVIITPHVAFYSKEAEESILKTTVENINNFISGTPVNLTK